MPLRFRLIGLVCFVLVVSLALGGLIAYSNASRSVRTEMRAALLVGRQTIETAVERVEGSGDPMRELDDLVASFKGNRHLRVRLGGKAATFAAPAVERSALLGCRPRQSESRSLLEVAITALSYLKPTLTTRPSRSGTSLAKVS